MSKVKNNQHNVTVIGLGRMGLIRIKEIEKHPRLKLTAVCDIDRKKIERFPNYISGIDYKQIIDKNIDIVFVCTYNNVSPSVVIYSLEKSKHVFCEKPPGKSVKDIEHIIEIEKQHPECRLKYGFNHRYHGSVMEAKRLIESGEFGDILWMRGIYGKAGVVQFENIWRNKKEISGGGVLLDQGIHMLDLFRYFAGDFDEVKSFITTSYWNIELEDNAFALLRNKKNQIAMLHSSATQWKHKFELDIFLKNGYIILEGILSSTRSYGDEKLIYAKKQFEDKSFAFGKPREEIIYFDTDNSWRLEIEDFVNSIENNINISSCNSYDSLASMKLVEAIYLNGKR